MKYQRTVKKSKSKQKFHTDDKTSAEFVQNYSRALKSNHLSRYKKIFLSNFLSTQFIGRQGNIFFIGC